MRRSKGIATGKQGPNTKDGNLSTTSSGFGGIRRHFVLLSFIASCICWLCLRLTSYSFDSPEIKEEISYLHPFLDGTHSRGQLKTKAAVDTNNGPFLMYNHLVKINGTQMIPHVNADKIWEMLLKEASREAKMSTFTPTKPSLPMVAIEVGMFSVKQCLHAVESGLEAFCIEASPRNFRSIERDVKFRRLSPQIEARLHIQNRAAAPISGQLVPFSSHGGTGDHVGVANAWEMSSESTIGAKDVSPSSRNHSNDHNREDRNIVQVETLALDDLIDKIARPIYVLKIDTQGFEVEVLRGLRRSLHTHKIRYILLEYWPRGLDLMTTSGNLEQTAEPCSSGRLMLQQLWDANYTLYHMSVIAHPAAGRPRAYRSLEGTRPLEMNKSFHDYCHWYLELEKVVNNTSYKMGYWTDILAVAPNDDGSRRLPALISPEQVVTQANALGKEGSNTSPQEPPELVAQIVGMVA